MGVVLPWILAAILVGAWSSSKINRFWYGFLWSFFLSPLIGALIVGFTQPSAMSNETASLADGMHRKCPFCAEIVKSEAVKCKHCGETLTPEKPAEIY